MSNYFENPEFKYSEIATLAEDIILPKSIDDYVDTEGKFYIKILTPLLDRSEIQTRTIPAPNTKKFKNDNIVTSPYRSVNYVKLKIPRYILMNFKNKVPSGTNFIIVGIGGEFLIDHISIVGISYHEN
jgi:hypothetical protein